MIEPTSQATAAATLVATGIALPLLASAPAVVPQIVVFGIALGLRADVLVAGFAGALVAIVLLDTVPAATPCASWCAPPGGACGTSWPAAWRPAT